jgi:two-component system chemotaxis response regulator CheB
MQGRDIIVIGCSAGGVQALTEIVRGLPHDLPAAVFVVMHTSPSSPGILPQILDRAGPLPAEHAYDDAHIRPGRIYVAPPDHHLIIKRRAVRIVRGPRENGFRPAVDPLFRTAARAFNKRVIGVILSGGLDDGTEGLLRIKQCGGCAVVQDPEEAVFPSMPAHAIRNVDCDHVVPLAQIPSLLAQLAKEPIPDGAADMSEPDCPIDGDDDQRDIAEVGNAALRVGNMTGPPSAFTCPECGGALWELTDDGLIRFRCHVGHGYTGEGLAVEHARKLEAALWTALRALEENAAIRRRMAERSKGQRWESLAGEYERQAKDSEERAALIREVLVVDDIKARASGDIPRKPDPVVPTKDDRARRGRGGHPKHGRDGNGNGNGNGSRHGRRPRGGDGDGAAAGAVGKAAASAALAKAGTPKSVVVTSGTAKSGTAKSGAAKSGAAKSGAFTSIGAKAKAVKGSGSGRGSGRGKGKRKGA